MNEKTMDVEHEAEEDAFDLIYQLDDNPPVKEGMLLFPA